MSLYVQKLAPAVNASSSYLQVLMLVQPVLPGNAMGDQPPPSRRARNDYLAPSWVSELIENLR
jgi:hypothetical protein